MEGVSHMLLTRLWRRLVKRDRQPPTTPMRLFWQANRDREAGRFEEAAALVEQGLHLDPDNVVGLLLAGSLHAVFREMHLARGAFERVLALDAAHPRALLGLARIAMEEGQLGTCTDYLRRALTRYPEFPEAQALLEVASHSSEPAAASHSAPRPEVRLDRLRVPADSREALMARIDATLIFAQPRGARTEEVAARTSHLCRVASAMLSRCQLGPLHHAVLEGAAETTFLRADEDIVLSIAFGHDVQIETGLAHLERVWANCRHELGIEVA
jgi:tetratricopeptide (TPR) repeat protein